MKIQESTRNNPWKYFLESTWLWMYLPNQTKTNCLTHWNFLLRKTTEPENWKLCSSQTHYNGFLTPTTVEKHRNYSFSTRKNWPLRNTKITLVSSILLQWTKFQKFWVDECSLYQCTLLITIQSKGTIIFTWQISFSMQSHSTFFVWQSRMPEKFVISLQNVSLDQNHDNVKILPSTKMTWLLQNMVNQKL